MIYDVTASVCEIGGTGSDAAYSLCGYALTVDEFLAELRAVLTGGYGLTNTANPCRLEIDIVPAGAEDEAARIHPNTHKND
jgi:hypothetical protein